MKIKFDANQQYQLDAIQAVVDLLEGQAHLGDLAYDVPSPDKLFEQVGFRNRITLDKSAVLANTQKIQEQNEIQDITDDLGSMDFSIEMETGTGKTYVYLRSIFELYQKYGLKKFIIVVPNVAIREGVLTSLDLMHEHFAEIYNNTAYSKFVYSSKKLEKIHNFATNNSLQIMIMNIDAFNKSTNIINRTEDLLLGSRPIDFIRQTNPVLVLDEPQNMESEKSKAALASLNSLFTLRYSATHREQYNLLYKLDPVKAYELKLVKQIEVAGVIEDGNFNTAYILLKDFKISKKEPLAKLEVDILEKSGVKRKTLSLKQGENLADKTKREMYTDFIIDEVNAGDGYVSFKNGQRLYQGQSFGVDKDAIMKVQVEETVRTHLNKELSLSQRQGEQQIKVLSLFFIDKVANYVQEEGKIRKWFIEAYTKFKNSSEFSSLSLPPVTQVHNGYFAKTKAGLEKDTTGNSADDGLAYEKIMQDKEGLLSIEEPLRFIFSHSALREGWDNPNVFQICTLNESKSDMRKRQELGRGLRLPVMTNGERCFEDYINRVTVIANQSYESFAQELQTEIEEDTGVSFNRNLIKNKRERHTAQVNKRVYQDSGFKELWERIKHKTRYAVEYDTQQLIEDAANAIESLPAATTAKIAIQKGRIERDGFEITGVGSRRIEHDKVTHPVPDVITLLQNRTNLTRSSIVSILLASNRLDDLALNPQEFLDSATRAVRKVLQHYMINGIKYERIQEENYEMRLFESIELQGYLGNMLQNTTKHVYDVVEYDSDIEYEFAKGLENREDIKLYIKLPYWFKVETPIGTYNPDWAILKKEDEKLYLVRETKGSITLDDLREIERQKILCGEKHFETLGVDYAVVSHIDHI